MDAKISVSTANQQNMQFVIFWMYGFRIIIFTFIYILFIYFWRVDVGDTTCSDLMTMIKQKPFQDKVFQFVTFIGKPVPLIDPINVLFIVWFYNWCKEKQYFEYYNGYNLYDYATTYDNDIYGNVTWHAIWGGSRYNSTLQVRIIVWDSFYLKCDQALIHTYKC